MVSKNSYNVTAIRAVATVILIIVALAPSPAAAYIGPGLGVAAIWILLGPLAAIIVLIAIIGYYPARYFYKKYKYNRQNSMPGQREDKSGNNDERHG